MDYVQDYVHPEDQTQPFEMTPGFKPFTIYYEFDSIVGTKLSPVYQLRLNLARDFFFFSFKKNY